MNESHTIITYLSGHTRRNGMLYNRTGVDLWSLKPADPFLREHGFFPKGTIQLYTFGDV